MNWDQIEGNWKQMKGKVKEQCGKRDQLVGTIQEQYGYSKERAEEELDRWAKDHKSTNPERPSKY